MVKISKIIDCRVDIGAYPDKLVLSTCSKILAIWTEADTPNVQVADRFDRLILKDANFLASYNIEDLRGSIAASGNVLSVMTKSDTADYTLMGQGVKEINIKNSRNSWIEDSKPIFRNLLLVRRQTLQI